MSRRRILKMAAGLTALAALGAVRPAHAYVRYKTEGGAPFAWKKTCLGIIAYPAAVGDMMPQDQVMAAAVAAGAAWSAPAVDGTALDIQVAPSLDDPPTASFDGQSSLIFRRDSWCKATDPAGTCTYDPSALALTSVFARTSTGEILDADIEVNAALFTWGDVELAALGGTATTAAGKQDLQNALTHEMGHFIGLDHTCALPGQPHPVDNLGNPVPDCDSAPEAVRETTMFPSAEPGDVSKRTLAPDDEQAARDVYPAAPGAAPAACPAPQPKAADPPPASGCRLAGGDARATDLGVAAAALAAALALRTARRRRRQLGRGKVQPTRG
jgi:hypothetical protein